MNSSRKFLRAVTALLVVAGALAEPVHSATVLTITSLTYDSEPDGVLHLTRTAEGTQPEIHRSLGNLSRGTLKVAWRQTMERYTQGPKQPNPESLYTVRFLTGNGQLFFHLAFLGEKGGGGAIIASGADGSLARWQPGEGLRLELEMNLDSNTCNVAIGGKVRAKDIPVKRPGPAQHLQFRDATGLGLQDGRFALTLDDIQVTHEAEPPPLRDTYRAKPPVDGPAPRLNPKPADAKNWTVPGEVRTSWVGNTFGGASGKDGHQNGFGEWVQNGVAPGAFVVTPDGTAVAGLGWDEAGRNIGLYKDGKVNPRLVAQYDMRGGHSAWGFGSANHAVAADGEWLYAGNHDGHLMRFRWTPGDLDSHRWVDQLELGKEWVARALAARADKLAALFNSGEVVIWQMSAQGFARIARWEAPKSAKTLCYAPDGGLWFVAEGKVVKRSAEGTAITGAVITDAGQPTAVSVAPDRTLLVCDNGPRQQVRFYDVSGVTPKLLKTFGDEGGLRSGVPGTPGPRKLYGLAGAGLDQRGNLHVACCLHVSSRGTAIKSFDPAGNPLWNLECHAFTDGYTFDPSADGTELVGADELISLDLTKSSGEEWSLKALTLDPLRYPKDPRLANEHGSCTSYQRILGGRRLLYTIGMQSGGFTLYAFEDGPGHVAHRVGFVGKGGKWGGEWAWSVDARGDIWSGDAKDRTIKRYRFLKWDGDTPVFNTEAPDSWPSPAGLCQTCRVLYDVAADALYLGAYPDGVAEPAWGAIGSVLERYDGWTKGTPVRRWRVDLPLDGQKVYPKAMDIVGDYAFVVAVKSSGGRDALVNVFRLSDGASVGQIWPGKAVGGASGWVDITHALHAHRRAGGEYLILVEEDFRGKNILYRWLPNH